MCRSTDISISESHLDLEITRVDCIWSDQLAFYVNLHRWRPDIDLRRMLTGVVGVGAYSSCFSWPFQGGSSVAVLLCMSVKATVLLTLSLFSFFFFVYIVSQAPFLDIFIIVIKHGFSCINIRQVPSEVLKTEAEGRGFQHLPRDLANVNALKKHVRSLLLHKNWKHLLHFALFLALFCFAFSPISC